MTKDETLRLALEFIPSINPAFICEASHHKKHEQHASNEPCPHVAKQKQVYEAIKAALEAKDEPMKKLQVTLEDRPVDIELAQYKRMFEDACANLGAINQALGLDFNDGGAESILFAIEELRGRSQEPVAWMVYALDGKSVCVTDNPTNFTPEHRALPLYTTPPQRTWVGLTDDERSKIWGELPQTLNEERDACIFAEAIELYLKERNK
jgi:hypothetical protein